MVSMTFACDDMTIVTFACNIRISVNFSCDNMTIVVNIPVSLDEHYAIAKTNTCIIHISQIMTLHENVISIMLLII
jgi:hypothetical protein